MFIESLVWPPKIQKLITMTPPPVSNELTLDPPRRRYRMYSQTGQRLDIGSVHWYSKLWAICGVHILPRCRGKAAPQSPPPPPPHRPPSSSTGLSSFTKTACYTPAARSQRGRHCHPILSCVRRAIGKTRHRDRQRISCWREEYRAVLQQYPCRTIYTIQKRSTMKLVDNFVE